jgi:RNA polymerase sigma-70 factor (ECF subfamily)
MMGQPFDRKELAELRQRNPQAVERWFTAYADNLYTFIFYHAGKDADLAAELVQETFVSAIRKIEEFDPDKGNMCTWLNFLSKNHISKALKDRGKQKTLGQIWADLDSDLADAFAKIATEVLPDEIMARQETAELVQMTLASIPDNYRAALRAYYYHKKSIKEMANSMGVEEGAVKTLLHRARKAFEEAFLKSDESFGEPRIIKGEANA